MHSAIRIGLIGDFQENHKAHLAIPKQLAASGAAEAVWVPSESVGAGEALAEFDGLWCVPGTPYRSADGVMRAIQHARMARKPFLGTSAGFQYAILEYARHVLGLSEADHQRTNPKAALPLISHLDAALAGVRARVTFAGGSRLHQAYGSRESIEQYHCSFGLNPRYRRLIEGAGLMATAVDDDDEVRAVELDGHPFYVATLFQPELRSPSPLVKAFVAAAERCRQGAIKAAS
jgi:CTP synthase (UTP-ammonia lyase)